MVNERRTATSNGWNQLNASFLFFCFALFGLHFRELERKTPMAQRQTNKSLECRLTSMTMDEDEKKMI